MSVALIDQIHDFLSKQPDINCNETDIEYSLKGSYCYCLQYKEVILQGERKINLVIPKNFPQEVPKLFLDNYPDGMEHVYQDGACCLASTGEIIQFLSNNPSLSEFIKKFVDAFIFSIEWFIKYGTYPFGEREHGYKGLLDYYLTDWQLTKEQYWDLVRIVINDNYRGHVDCLCGSKKKMRDCHGKYILPIIKDPIFKEQFIEEAYSIFRGEKINGKR